MTHKVGPKGQVVIPKGFRDQLGIQPGDEVAFFLEAEGVRVERIRPADNAMGSLAGTDLLEDLERDHRRELDH